jgi:DNA sulfur modification protein DndD
VIFKSLTLENFGTYAGRQQLDLTPREGQPIILIGGANGAGKTTILEALQLCLHGRRALWSSISEAAYEDYLSGRIHVPPTSDQSPQEAAVTLTLDHVDGGHNCEYVVSRAWKRTRAGHIKEDLAIFRDGVQQDDVTGTMAQEFLDGLVPPALAGLFLFDGEKIQELADDDAGGALRDAIRRLLGLDVLENLREDLWRYVARDSGSNVRKKFRQAVEAAEMTYAQALEASESAHAQKQNYEEDRKTLDDSVKLKEDQFAAEGGSLAMARTELQRKLNLALKRESKASAQLSELTAGLLPLAICPEIAARLEDRLREDEGLEEDLIVGRRLDRAAEQLSTSVRPAGRSKVDVISLLREALVGDASETVEPLHDVSPGTRARMLSDLATIRGTLPSQAKQISRTLRRARADVNPLRQALDQAPDEQTIAPLLEEIQQLHRLLGELDQRIVETDQQIAACQHSEKVADRELRKARERLASAQGLNDRAHLAGRTVEVLKAFETRLGERQLREVELQTARLFNRLSRKGDLLSDVSIDLDGFDVRLRRWDQTEIRKAQLSAGERQLFAIAVLWALATVSGRPLPVVIDTPLARLDREHRAKLLREYLPEVSSQVIVLSTDTEIDAAAADPLSPFTARRYRLEHDAASCATSIVSGYFCAEEEQISAR